MKKMISLMVVLVVCLFFAGCADINTTNQLIANANKARLVAYGDGMAACGSNAACQVGLSAAFFSGSGQHPYYKPDTPVDYLRTGLPWLDAFDRIASRFSKTSRVGDSSGLVLVGDNNTVSGVGNRFDATQSSSIVTPWSQSITRPSTISYGAGSATTQPYEVRPDVVSVE